MVMAHLRLSYYTDDTPKVFVDPIWLGGGLKKGAEDYSLDDVFIESVLANIQKGHPGLDWGSETLEIFMCVNLHEPQHWVVVLGKAREKKWRCV